MGLLSRWLGTDPDKREQKGDLFFGRGSWGPAKIEYEAALHHLDVTLQDHTETKRRLNQKIDRSKESLAADHLENGVNLMEQGYDGEAGELFQLALELTGNPELENNIGNHLLALASRAELRIRENLPLHIEPAEAPLAEFTSETENDRFAILCGTLPEPVQTAYLSYGETFKSGYMALNSGDFQAAVKHLARAMIQYDAPDSYIPLELATAHMNLGDLTEARRLLEPFVERHPDLLPGYQLLCEVLWESGDFELAESVLSQCAEEVKNSVAHCLLMGQTLSRAGRYQSALSVYQGFSDKFGWNESIVRAIAETCEWMGDTGKARVFYAQILDRCSSCHARVDPFIKRRYADICFGMGEYTPAILEIYLSLVREDPDNRAHHYRKISRIYAAMGNETEAGRFLSFARQADEETR